MCNSAACEGYNELKSRNSNSLVFYGEEKWGIIDIKRGIIDIKVLRLSGFQGL